MRIEYECRHDKDDSGRGVLHAQGRTPVDAAAEALLVERADRDAAKPNGGEDPGNRPDVAGRRLLVDDQEDAGKSERQAKPLSRQNALAEPAIGKRRGQDRLQAYDQRDQTRRDAVLDGGENAAEVTAVDQRTGHGT